MGSPSAFFLDNLGARLVGNGAGRPFLRWPGGKRWIVPHVRRLIEGYTFKRFFEPFLGGGAVFFGLRPEKAFLSDIDKDLINTYRQVKQRPLELIGYLRKILVNRETYLGIRASEPGYPIARAVRFLYLNRTAFSGIHRLNRKGQFNVPFGGAERTPAPLWTKDLLIDASTQLRNVTLAVGDFEDQLKDVGEGDLIYCDPTYTSAHNDNAFIRYNDRNFSWVDQKRLAKVSREAASKGAVVLVSNAFRPEIAELYRHVQVSVLNRASLLCPMASRRKVVKEYLFIVWPNRKVG